MVLDSTWANAFIIPRVTHFLLFSTRLTEFLQLQLDCRFEIQIYDGTQKSESLLKVPFQIYNALARNPLRTGSEPRYCVLCIVYWYCVFVLLTMRTGTLYSA
jgi:hypothetical protein